MARDGRLDVAIRRIRHGHYDVAIQLLRALLAENLHHDEVMEQLSVVGYQTRHSDLLAEVVERIGPEPATWACGALCARICRTLDRDEDSERYRRRAEDILAAGIAGNAHEWSLRQGLGDLRHDFDDPAGAVAMFEEALRLTAAEPPAVRARLLNRRGTALRGLRRLEEAEHAFREAIALQDDSAFQTNLAMLLLLQERYPEGWDRFERRLPTPAPERYTADSLRKRTVVFLGEQGHGDQIQTVRFARLAKQYADQVIVTCNPPLLDLFASCEDIDEVLPRKSDIPGGALGVAIMSTPRLFNTERGSIPPPAGFRPNPDLLRAFPEPIVEALEAGDHPRKIGIAWGSNRFNDKGHARTCPLPHLEPLFGTEDIQWFSLQEDLHLGDRERLERAGVCNLAPHLTTFAHTAAVIDRLDLVISVDTSVAHLAGAVGKPLLLALPFDPDWRWLLDTERSSWYESARLCRQPTIGDWPSVVNDLRQRLEAWLRTGAF